MLSPSYFSAISNGQIWNQDKTPTYIYFWNHLVEPVKIFLVKSPPIWYTTTLPDAALLLHPMWCMHCMWQAPLTLFLLYHKLFSDHELFTDHDTHALEYFTILPDAALLLHPMWCMHFMWQAPLALFLLYRELFSNCELFTDRELLDTNTLAPPHMTHTLCVASSACSFSIVTWTLFWLWTLYRP